MSNYSEPIYIYRAGQLLSTIEVPGECIGELSFLLAVKRTADLEAAAITAIL